MCSACHSKYRLGTAIKGMPELRKRVFETLTEVSTGGQFGILWAIIYRFVKLITNTGKELGMRLQVLELSKLRDVQ